MDNVFGELFSSFWGLVLYILKAFSPLFIGLILAYILNGPVEWVRTVVLKKRKNIHSLPEPKGRGMSIFITYTAITFILILLVYTFIVLMLGAVPPKGIIHTIQALYEYFSSYYGNLLQSINQHLPEELGINKFNPRESVIRWIDNYFSAEKIMNVFSHLISIIVNFFLGLIASIYFLKDKEFFLSLWQNLIYTLLPMRLHRIIKDIFSEINSIVITFIKGAIIDGVIVALISSIMLTVSGIKFAAIIGILSGTLNIIPYFGPLLSMIPAFLLVFSTQSLYKGFIAIAIIRVQHAV